MATLRELLGSYQAKQNEIALLQEQLPGIKQKFQDMLLRKLKKKKNDHQRAALMDKAYWLCFELRGAVIRCNHELKIRWRQSPMEMNVECRDCFCSFPYLFKSWDHVKGYELGLRQEKRGKKHRGHNIRCPECANKDEKESQQQRISWDIHRQELEQEKKERIAALRALPYSEYLQSEHWKTLRLTALKRASFRCQLCNRKNELNVHHRTYENLGNEYVSDLTVLCRNCHEKFHDIYK